MGWIPVHARSKVRARRTFIGLNGSRALGALGAVVALAALPTAAQAKTAASRPVKVYTGPPPNAARLVPALGKSLKKLAAENPDVNAFFPSKVTIHAGDTIQFIRGMMAHTVDIPAKGGADLPLIVPAGSTISGIKDAAGRPFWFNGQPALTLNPALPTQSKKPISVTYNGTKRVDSGFYLGSGSAPVFSVKFTKTGTFTVLCDLHHGMQATVVVLPKTKVLPSAANVKATLVAQLRAALKSLRQAAKIVPPANTVSVGSGGPGGAELFAMFPSSLQVSVGATVTFKMSPDSREVHTVTFGPESYLKTLAGSFLTDPQITQQILYPSDVPTVSLNPTSHGNGFANLGALDTESATPLPSSGTVTFTAPGTYHYMCMIHPFMQGTVSVGP